MRLTPKILLTVAVCFRDFYYFFLKKNLISCMMHKLVLGCILFKISLQARLLVSHPNTAPPLFLPAKKKKKARNIITEDNGRPRRTRFLYASSTIFPLNHLMIYSIFHGPIAGPSTLQVLYSPRDYRSEGASASEWKEVTVRSGTEVLLQPQDSSKVCKFKLSSVVSLSLSA